MAGEHPRFTTVAGCSAREVGLYEKQSSFFVQVTADRSHLGRAAAGPGPGSFVRSFGCFLFVWLFVGGLLRLLDRSTARPIESVRSGLCVAFRQCGVAECVAEWRHFTASTVQR